jgi:hypothetical protein
MRINILFALIGLTIPFILSGQTSLKRTYGLPEPPVCYASGKTEKGFVNLPPELMNRLKSSTGGGADIQVTYFQFPDNVKNAFDFAVSIWEGLIKSSVPIKIKATWQSLGANILGSCSATDYFKNFDGAPTVNKYYTIAAAEKLSGKDLNAGGYEIQATFNKDMKWYFGTDGLTPDSLYDFVSTVLHEITHGLSFSGYFYTSGTRGGYGTSTEKIPTIYDSYVETFDRKSLSNTSLYINPSVDLYRALTSTQLYTGNPVSLFSGTENRPRIYAPAQYNDGSSIYHLNEASYPSGTINSLMTPAAGKGEAAHYPGPLTLDLTDDTGWKNVYIRFNKPTDIEALGQAIPFEASITSDYPLDTTSVYLIYSFDKFKSSIDSVRLLPSQKLTFFNASLKAPSTPGAITYYIKARDTKRRLFTQPPDAPNYVFDLKVGPDTIKPVVKHLPTELIFSKTRTLPIKAFVTDNIGVDTVYIEYFLNDKAKPAFGLKLDSVTRYTGVLKFSGSDIKGGDSIRYRIIASDKSSNANKRIMPATGYYKTKVEGIYNPVIKYYTDFDSPNTDFVNKDFSIKTETGFSDGALHSPHPYPSPDKEDTSYNFVTYLRYPIILKKGEIMSYSEVVLIEPGDPGSKFGDPDFWDYAIAEGSKDYGETWKPLLDGYDSNSNTNWYNNYYLHMSGNNSTTTGKKEMFVNRRINLLASSIFSEGDTILLRFRIFSDPFAHGWGWAIDYLSIQLPVSVRDLAVTLPGNFLIYPNPFKDKILINMQTNNTVMDLSISVFNQFGQMVSLVTDKNVMSGYRREINVDHLPPGIYLINIIADGEKINSQKLIKQN